VLDKTVDLDDVQVGSADPTEKCRQRHRGWAAGAVRRLRRIGVAVALGRIRTGDFFARAWKVLRTEGSRGALRHTWQFFISQSFSSLTRRIVFLNIAGLLAFVIGILYLTQFRAGLIDARVQSLIVQGELIAIRSRANRPRPTLSTSTLSDFWNCRRAKATVLPITHFSALSFPSTRNGWRRCCGG